MQDVPPCLLETTPRPKLRKWDRNDPKIRELLKQHEIALLSIVFEDFDTATELHDSSQIDFGISTACLTLTCDDGGEAQPLKTRFIGANINKTDLTR